MKLQEIQRIFDELEPQKEGETMGEYASRYWNGLPHIPFKELPWTMQKSVRERFSADDIKDFLQECYVAREYKELLEHISKYGGSTPQEVTESFARFTDGIPAEDLQALMIRTRNTAIYTVEQDEGGLTPMLYGNYCADAFERVIDEYRAKQKAKEQQKPQRRENIDALVSAGNYQYVISDKKFQHALTIQQNNNAYIALMQPDFFKRLDFKDGTVTFDRETAGIIQQYHKGQYTDVQELDFPLLTQIYTAAVKSNIRHDTYTITVDMPKFFREMGIEASKGNAPDIMAKLRSFENCIGIMPGTKSISRLFIILDMDMKNQTMTIACPYIFRLYDALIDKNHIERKTHKGELLDFEMPFQHKLVHSSIAKERNKVAVEIVYFLVNGLVNRGTVPDIKTYKNKYAKTNFPDRVTYSICFRTLINNTPFLRGRLLTYANAKDKNKALRRAFTKAYELLKTHTDAHKKFVNLKCNAIIPTMTTLDDEIIITHDGKNADYKPEK